MNLPCIPSANRASQSFPEPHRASQSLSRLPKHPGVSQSIPEIPKPFQSSQTATKAKTLKKPRKTHLTPTCSSEVPSALECKRKPHGCSEVQRT